MNPPNVLLVVLDGAYLGRLGFAGHRPSPTPFLDSLAERGLTMTEAKSTGGNTSFSLPGLLGSSYPLDFGGYELVGRTARPALLAEVFAAAGYRTGCMSGSPIYTPMYGYHRGYETCATSFGPAHGTADLLKPFRRHFARRHEAKSLPLERIRDDLAPYVEAVFETQRWLLEQRLREAERSGARRSTITHNWDLERVADLIDLEERWYRRDPRRYVERLLESPRPDYVERQATLSRPVVPPIPQEVLDGVVTDLGLPGGPTWGRTSARFACGQLQDWIDEDDGRPFFGTLHLMDAHEFNFLSFDLGEDFLPQVSEEVARAAEHLDRIRATPGYSGVAIYDLALRYMDERLRELFDFLRARGRLDDTVVCVTADHGWHCLDPQIRRYSFEEFYPDNVDVPLVFVGPGVPRRRDEGLCSLVDVAPTLLEAAGIAKPESHRGESLLSRAGPRPYVLHEHLGEGPCNFRIKEMRLAVTTERFKLVARIPPVGKPGGGAVARLADRRADPMELRDLRREPPPEARELLALATARAREIRAGLGVYGNVEGTRPVAPTPAAPADAGGLDLERVLEALVEAGRGAAALPALEAAIARLARRDAADDSGFELDDLVAELERGGEGEVAGWMLQAVGELTAGAPLAAAS